MKQNTSATLEELRLVLHGVTVPFHCEGTFVPQKPVTLVFKNQKTFTVVRAAATYQQQNELRPLLKHCETAPFGAGKQTRYDRNVRDAFQLKAAGGALAVSNFDPETAGILQAIQRELAPRDPNPISAELYAVNVYTEGGHFAKHKDTPRGGDMLGTLVVCLPSQFRRGRLMLSHHGIVRRLDWGAEIESQTEPNQLHWAAFFGDVDHEIEEVWSGARVTLAYLLRRGEGSSPGRDGADEHDMEPRVQAAWQGLLADRSFLPEGGTLAYPCGHLYHQDARLQQEPSAITVQAMPMLKGRDQLVATSALAAGLEVTFHPYLFEDCGDSTWQLDRFPTRKEQSRLGKRMDDDRLNRILPIRESVKEDGDVALTWLDPRPSCDQATRRTDPDDEFEVAAAAHLHACEYSPWGYFGNEASDSEFYIYAALHVEIPPLGEGPRPAGKAPKRAPAKRKPAKRKRGSNGD